MSRFNIRSTYKPAVAAALILAVLGRVPFVGGLLLHDHSDHGVHSHAVTPDDLRDGDLCAAWYRDHGDSHDDDHDDRDNDPAGDEYADPLFLFVSAPVAVMGIRCSSGAVIASIQHPSSKAWPRSMLLSDSADAYRFSATPWPLAHPLRPDSALDALLQSSRALLL